MNRKQRRQKRLDMIINAIPNASELTKTTINEIYNLGYNNGKIDTMNGIANDDKLETAKRFIKEVFMAGIATAIIKNKGINEI